MEMFKNPGYVFKPIIGRGYCVIRSFQEGLSFCLSFESLDSLLVELRSEIMRNYDFYSKFSTKDVNVLLELNSFLKTPPKYYKKDTVDLFLLALRNSYNCRTIIYECTRTYLRATDLSKDNGNCEKSTVFYKN